MWKNSNNLEELPSAGNALVNVNYENKLHQIYLTSFFLLQVETEDHNINPVVE
jgi:hypothetical protein